MHDDGKSCAVQSPHGIAEDVAADCLDDVFHEFWVIGFDAFPLFHRADAFIGHRITAEPVQTNFRLHGLSPRLNIRIR